jgi:hypothetical protein
VNSSALPNDLPFELRVSCSCPSLFHLRVGLAETNSLEAAHACIRCGKLTATEVLWEHIHHNAYNPYGRREKQLPSGVLTWLDRWPRVIEGKHETDYVFISPQTRCADEKELAKLIAETRETQLALPRGRRLHLFGAPSEPPPPELPQAFEDYRQLWRASQLNPSTDPDTLLRFANPRFRPTSALATDCLLQRSDAAFLIGQAAANSDSSVRQTIYSIVKEEPALLPPVLNSLLGWMDDVIGRQGAGFEGQSLEELLGFLAKQKSAQARITPALEAAKARLSRAAYELSRKFTETIRALNGEPPLPATHTPWFFNL